jgi:2',3'-cyclic-nucleotide 2'-phosphodiesterase (5'-nucleotidase family)
MIDTLNILTTPKTLGDWHTTPVVATVRKYAMELKSQSDLIVLLAHIDGREESKILNSAPEIPRTFLQ